MAIVDLDASLLGSASLSAESSVQYSASSNFSGSSTVQSLAGVVLYVSSSLAGSSTLQSSATRITQASTSILGAGSLLATALKYVYPSCALLGTSTLQASLAYAISATFQGVSSLSAAPVCKYAPVATLVGSASVQATLNVSLGYAAPLRFNAAPREVPSNAMVFDPVDLFLSDGKTRAQEVTPSQLTVRVFYNGTQVNWPIVSGTSTPDTLVSSGRLYWTEFTTGFYSMRFYPNAVGMWRIIITYAAHDQAISLTYNVRNIASSASTGLRVSFSRR